MLQSFKNRWILLLVLAVFIVCKIPYLHYSYYWDESYPYAAAVKAMYVHGPSLIPGSIDPELSRGHPLLFHVLIAIWMNVFGSSHIATHSFSLFISVLLLIAIYEAGLRLFNQRVAVISLLLVATQVIFFVQASSVLLEIMVALLVLLSLCFYVKDKYFLACLSLTALFYTKESGMVLGLLLGIDALVRMFNKKEALRSRIYRLCAIAVPVLLIAVFFLIQKRTFGWYIFPLHADMIQLKWDKYWFDFRMSPVHTTFCDANRYYYFVLVLIFALIAAIKSRKIKYLAILLPAYCIYYFVDDMRAGRILPSVPFFIVFITVVFYFLYVYSRPSMYSFAYQRRMVFLSGVFILMFLCFSAMNFFTPRYMLAEFIPLYFICAVFLDTYIANSFKWLYYPLLLLILAVSAYAWHENDGYSDCDLGSYDGMDVQQKIVDYVEDHNYYDKTIASGSFLEREHFNDPSTGFLRKGKMQKTAIWFINGNTDLIIFDNIVPDYRYNNPKEYADFQLIYRYQKGRVWAEIYGRK